MNKEKNIGYILLSFKIESTKLFLTFKWLLPSCGGNEINRSSDKTDFKKIYFFKFCAMTSRYRLFFECNKPWCHVKKFLKSFSRTQLISQFKFSFLAFDVLYIFLLVRI